MGDIADYLMDQALDYGESFYASVRRDPTCRKCGARCTWHHTGERWVLWGTRGRHACDISGMFENLTLIPEATPAPPLLQKMQQPRPPGNKRGRAYAAKRMRAKPAWCTWAEIGFIEKWARAMTVFTGVQHSVDHIVPLSHPLVNGLHCPANLRAIPAALNAMKGNNWWPDMWGEQAAFAEFEELL